MFEISGDFIRLTRGDTAIFEVALSFNGGEAYALQPGDRLVFGARRSVYDAEYALYKELSGSRLELSPMDTSELSFGRYVYDLELTTADGEVHTVVACATFEICPEVVTDA